MEPDGFVYDAKEEERSHARSLLSPKELSALKKSIAKEGYMPIQALRLFVEQNTSKEVDKTEVSIDPEILLYVDARIDYRVFIAGDQVYSRAEIMSAFPFQQLAVVPEDVLSMQEVGVFSKESGEPEYVAHDVGGPGPLTCLSDALRPTATPRPPDRIARTKVFVGRQKWEDFLNIISLRRGLASYLAPLAASQNRTALEWFFGVPATATPALPPPKGSEKDILDELLE